MDKEYIRFTTKGLRFEGMVAKYTRTLNRDNHVPEMYGFIDDDGLIQFVPSSEAEFISRKQYFTTILSGPGKYKK